MKTRPLGSTGLNVSEIAFGAWQLGNNDAWGGMTDSTAHRLIGEALDAGINLFDTAPNYASTNSERLLGEALSGKRDQVVLVSKFGHRPDGPKEFTVDWFWKSLEASLQRLRTDHLDVLLLHNPDTEMYAGTDPLWAALEEAQQQGKIRHYGASLDFAAEAEACVKNTGSTVLEIFFNILHQDIRTVFPLLREQGVGTIVKVPLDSGWLTGRFNSASRFDGVRVRWSAEQVSRRAELIAQLVWLTADGSELSHKALAFLLAYDEVGCVIPGMRSSEQLQSNIAATNQTISPQEREKLESFWETFTLGGKELLPW